MMEEEVGEEERWRRDKSQEEEYKGINSNIPYGCYKYCITYYIFFYLIFFSWPLCNNYAVSLVNKGNYRQKISCRQRTGKNVNKALATTFQSTRWKVGNPFPLSTAKRLISWVCRSAWDNTLHDALHTTSMGQYHRTNNQYHKRKAAGTWE